MQMLFPFVLLVNHSSPQPWHSHVCENSWAPFCYNDILVWRRNKETVLL
ncbi:hypothetical protein CIPAW_10G151100 [Carya illinoinensis]|uniref:Uncharacterized protein n=1 Tax=Carya illinoinensis TaxID=32201 RepID=A0A8T1PGC4_CARIL|nr:hypothetical protein CIPAW_10G151100 [Carya illinoinensis]